MRFHPTSPTDSVCGGAGNHVTPRRVIKWNGTKAERGEAMRKAGKMRSGSALCAVAELFDLP
ncbi:MAG: hypothetical protein IJK52_09055, partial [Oscillospiraceae bacterium]|nr:hypothetical protein [Oscillospiraceae bacterium]